ncbi:MAG: hypothetical protein JWM20_607 [Patescibacteria group bacterium]|nr:hypothetical protein [Patescibacteria group bacterium]
MFGTHHYQVVAKNACGTDSAICIASDRGCEWAATGISEIFEDDRVVSKCILDISGRIVSVNSKLPLGTYEEICITARGTVRIKRIVIFK